MYRRSGRWNRSGLALSLICFLWIPIRAEGLLRPVNLRCEYKDHPLGIHTPAPRLSWVLEGKGRGLRQSHYQIQVASSQEQLQEEICDFWDTGKVPSSEQNQIAYAGKSLSSMDRCFWRVRVWDQSENPSPWSKQAFWSMGLLSPKDWKANWIGLPSESKETYQPCVYLRKEPSLPNEYERATLHVTAAGLYAFTINGKRVGKDFFTPGWTEYEKRIYYQTYDVTDLLKPGVKNVLGAVLGDGWYGLHHGGRGRLALLAQLHLEKKDGTSHLIVTDDTWRATREGPIRMSDIYQGETYDARKEMPGWNKPGFNDSNWRNAQVDPFGSNATWKDVTDIVRKAVKGKALHIQADNAHFGDPIYGKVKQLRVIYEENGREKEAHVQEGQTLDLTSGEGQLSIVKAEYGADMGSPKVTEAVRQSHLGNPVRKIEEIVPVKITEPQPGAYVLDMGQNFSGWVRIRAEGEEGQEITLRFAERCNPDGTVYTTNLRKAACTDRYIMKGEGIEVWEPLFTFHGFQYVEIKGLTQKPDKHTVTGVVLHSDAPLVGGFECSNPMLNQLFQNIVWGQRSNYLEVPTDCPQRDERMGWSGDAQVFIGTGAYNMDIAAFFTSWLTTYADSQNPEGGYANVSPKGGGVSPGWGDAGVICPWTLYRMYGDKRILENHYEGMAKWIRYLEERSENDLRPAQGFGDWVSVNAPMPKDVIATAYFAYSTHLMSQIAEVLGRSSDAAHYRARFEKIRSAFTEAYVKETGHIKGNTQTTYLLALGFDLLPEDLRTPAKKRLLERLEARDCHLSVGFLGVNLLLPVLTEIGEVDLAYKLIQNETYPSWGYPIRHGATTVWERWDGWTEAKGFQTPGMNSFNHYAFGACGQWMFETMAGISPEKPGFEKVRIRPLLGDEMKHVKATYDSIRGSIEAHWRRKGDALQLEVCLPPNVEGTVWVPCQDPSQVREGGKHAVDADCVRFLDMNEGAALFEVGSGTYRFSVR